MSVMSRFLNEDELTKALIKIFEKVAEVNPSLQPSHDKQIEELARSTAQNLMKNSPDGAISKEAIKDPSFVNKLYITATLTLTLEKDNNLKQLAGIFNKLSPEDQLLMKNLVRFSPEEMKKMGPEFMKKFSPEDQELMKKLVKEICENIGINLEKNKLTPKLTPEKSAKLEDDGFNNLFNLLTNETGSIPVVVQVFMGNGKGFVDFDPYKSENTSNISLQDRTDEPYGDYLGLNNTARENYASNGSIFSAMEEISYAAGIGAPSLTIPKG